MFEGHESREGQENATYVCIVQLKGEKDNRVDLQSVYCLFDALFFATFKSEPTQLNQLGLVAICIFLKLSIHRVEEHISLGEEAEYHFFEVHLGQLKMKPVIHVDKELFESVLTIFCHFLFGLAGELVGSEAVDQFVDGELDDVRVVSELLIKLEEAKDELVGVALVLLVLCDLPGLL